MTCGQRFTPHYSPISPAAPFVATPLKGRMPTPDLWSPGLTPELIRACEAYERGNYLLFIGKNDIYLCF